MISRVRRLIFTRYTPRPHLGCIKWLLDFHELGRVQNTTTTSTRATFERTIHESCVFVRASISRRIFCPRIICENLAATIGGTRFPSSAHLSPAA